MSNTKTATNAAAAKQAATPGPWKTGAHDRGRFCVYSAGSNGRGICVMSNTQRTDASEIEKYGEHGDNLEADANARLIAAAPELLAALKHILINWEAIPDGAAVPDELNEDSDWNAARAAIAKATEGSAQ